MVMVMPRLDKKLMLSETVQMSGLTPAQQAAAEATERVKRQVRAHSTLGWDSLATTIEESYHAMSVHQSWTLVDDRTLVLVIECAYGAVLRPAVRPPNGVEADDMLTALDQCLIADLIGKKA